MKKALYIIALFTIILNNVNGQQCKPNGCTTGFVKEYPSSGAPYTPSSSWQVLNNPATGNDALMNGGNWTRFNVVSGNKYEWTYCEDYGGVSTSWDAQLTLFNNTNINAPICFSTDDCGTTGLAPYISWTATFTGVVRLLTTAYVSGVGGCQSNSSPYNKLVYRKIAGTTCTYSISTSSISPSSSSGNGSVSVTTTSGCSWTAVSNNTSWLTVTSGSSGNGNGTVNYSYTSNGTSSSRTGTIIIAGKTFTVTQAGTVSCSYAISTSSISPNSSSGSGSVSVTTTLGCTWTAISNNTSWLTVTSGSSGTGNGTVGYSYTTNSSSSSRTGTITIAGKTFTVTQAGIITSSSIDGIDVSRYQGTINWSQVSGAGEKVFAYIKATQGYTNDANDTYFSQNVTPAINSGLKIGAYHVAMPANYSSSNEATHFLNTAGSYIGSGYLPPALDIEQSYAQAYYNQGNSPAQLAQWINAWCIQIYNTKGIYPVLYVDRCRAADLYPYYQSGVINSKIKLWIADYGSISNPATPGSPGNASGCNWVGWPWLFHQYSETGSVSGITENVVDLDVFNGDVTAFNNLIGTSSSCTAPNNGIISPSSPTVTAPNSTSLTVTASGTTPFTYQWYWWNGTDWSALSNSSPYSGTTTQTLTINPTSTSMDGNYYNCLVSNSCGDQNDIGYVQLAVNSSPCTTPGIPASATGTQTGETTASLSWTAGSPAGSPDITYYWVVGTSPSVLYGNGIAQNTTNGNSAIATGLSPGTTYYLRVYAYTSCNETSSGYRTSSSFTTDVSCTAPNNGIISPSSPTVTAPNSTSLTVTASGTTPFTYQWYWWNGTDWSALSNSSPYSGTTTQTLTINPTSTSMDGNYYNCLVSNSCGDQNDIGYVQLAVNSSPCTTPGIPASATGTQTGETTASLSWTAGSPAGSPDVTYYWVVGTSSSVTYGNGIAQNTSSGTSASATGLSPGTTYYLRVCSYTSCDQTSSAYKTSSSFTTEVSCTTPGIPASATGTETGETTASLSWTAGSPAGNPDITYYWVVGTSPSVLYGNGIAQNTTNGNSAIATGLSPGTTYYLRVYAYTSCNETSSGYRTSSSFTTPTNICQPTWQPIQNQQYNMNVIAKLYLSDVLTTNPTDAIGAFVGQECRGIAYPDASFNGNLFLTITSNVQSGETITFKAWKSSPQCEECLIAETMPFVNQSEIGTMNNPFEFHCGMTQLNINFGAGYTWFSVNVNPGSMALNSLFSNITPCENDRIIGQQAFATYYGTQWVGSLTTIDPTAMYKMKLCTQQTWSKPGSPVSIAPMTIASGYPWIGYMPQSDLPINSAITNIIPAPVSNDRFNGQSSFATYSGTQWVGSLTTLQKGKGFIIHLANSSVLTYPNGMNNSPAFNKSSDIITLKGDKLKSNPLYNMQIIANIILSDGSLSMIADDVVYAYVDNECRGMAKPVSELDGRLFLSVGSDIKSGEEVTFKVYLANENRLYDLNTGVVFSSELETGTMQSPYQFKMAGLTGIPMILNDQVFWVGEIYPNPFDATASLEYKLEKPGKIKAKIINGLGEEIQIVMNTEMEAGTYVLKLNGAILTPGFYYLSMTYTNNQISSVISKKMVIK